MKRYFLIDKIKSALIFDLISKLKNYPEFRNIEIVVNHGLRGDFEKRLNRGISFNTFNEKILGPSLGRSSQKISFIAFIQFKKRMLGIIEIAKEKYGAHSLNGYRNIFEKDFQIIDLREQNNLKNKNDEKVINIPLLKVPEFNNDFMKSINEKLVPTLKTVSERQKEFEIKYQKSIEPVLEKISIIQEEMAVSFAPMVEKMSKIMEQFPKFKCAN